MSHFAMQPLQHPSPLSSSAALLCPMAWTSDTGGAHGDGRARNTAVTNLQAATSLPSVQEAALLSRLSWPSKSFPFDSLSSAQFLPLNKRKKNRERKTNPCWLMKRKKWKEKKPHSSLTCGYMKNITNKTCWSLLEDWNGLTFCAGLWYFHRFQHVLLLPSKLTNVFQREKSRWDSKSTSCYLSLKVVSEMTRKVPLEKSLT